MSYLRTYHVKHHRDFSDLLRKAKVVADYAVANKNRHSKLSSAEVSDIKLPSVIACQILRKYSSHTIKEAKNVNLIVPNSSVHTYKKKDGTIKKYTDITYCDGVVTIKPLNVSFLWNPGRDFLKINQIEIDDQKYMISVSFTDNGQKCEQVSVLGVDLNCGVGRHICNCANLKNGEIVNFGKAGPNIRKYYFKKRQAGEVIGDKEYRIMKDMDHKISRQIVDYAHKHKLRIVLEDLKGIRFNKTKGTGSKTVNRLVNSWSFYRLQQFIEYKAKERGIEVQYIKPHYTSQECSFCGNIGKREKETFICVNKRCEVYDKKRNAYINAAFNIGKRGITTPIMANEEVEA